MLRKTKIICTLGPASDSLTEITRLIQAGMDIARLNMSHGSYKHHAKMIKNIRAAEKNLHKKIPILLDLQGPKIRIGKLKNPINIKHGEIIALGNSAKNSIPVTYPRLTKYLKKNDLIRINDGQLEVKVLKKSDHKLVCKVLTGGTINYGNGLNFPTNTISQNTITSKDKKDLKFGLKQKVNIIALSFVKEAKDIKNLRKLAPKTPIIAKIERHEAIKNLESIIKESDGVMVARGDLGADIPPEQVPIIQKKIITLANLINKPVITATQVMYSMIQNPTPTRAEVSDAANAVFDHSDAILLSNETSVGKYPFKAAKILKKIIIAAENSTADHEASSG
ncbi:pyruvate kinase [Candidatus Peregrinibacteria bacterium]|nr:pyruvate kinase [Candidatus Peregrinibacteria bacterium]